MDGRRCHGVFGRAVLGDGRTAIARLSAAKHGSAELATELRAGQSKEEEVACVVRQTGLVDDLLHRRVDDVPMPRHVDGQVERPARRVEVLALGEHGHQDVDERRRQSAEDDVERDGQKHGVRGRRLGWLEA